MDVTFCHTRGLGINTRKKTINGLKWMHAYLLIHPMNSECFHSRETQAREASHEQPLLEGLSVFLDSQWTTLQRKNLVNNVQGLSRDMIAFNDVYGEHSKLQTSAKMCIQMLSSGTKEAQRIPLPSGKLNKAMRQILDRAALGQEGAQFSLWASVPGQGAER